ncbi:MAG: S41 family peptidase [Candidatus Zixiibacteriota bacterium]
MHRGGFFTVITLRAFWVKALTPLFLIALLSVAGSFSNQAQAQTSGPNSEDRKIDARMQLEVIDSVTQALNEIYVFPDVAEKMEKHLRKQYKNKEYKDLTSLKEFTDKLTADLQEISKDKHLWVRFASDELLARFESDTLTDEEKKRELEEKRRNNFCFKEIKLLPGNVGYIDFRCFSEATDAGMTAIAAMNFLAYTDAIIFDLRQNGGGSPSMIQLISSYFFDEPKHLNSFYIRRSDSTEQFWSHAYVPGPRMSHVDLYVLTSSYTFSGAEEFTYNFKNMERATIIGETTGGGAHPIDIRAFENLNVGMSLPFGRAVNPITGTNWEGTGITPHIEVSQEKALDVAHLEALSKILEKTEDPGRKAQLQWAVDGKKVILNPITIEPGKLQAYVGQYGPRRIWIEDNQIYYQREERPKYKLIPMGDHWFMLEGLDYFRIQFVADENGEVNELIGHYDTGQTDGHKRSK